MMALDVDWLISVVAPELEICAWPATTEPPAGWALAPTLITTRERILAEASAQPRTRAMPVPPLLKTFPTYPNPGPRPDRAGSPPKKVPQKPAYNVSKLPDNMPYETRG